MIIDDAPRLFVGCWCRYCGVGFLFLSTPGADCVPLYCCTTHKRKASDRRHDTAPRRCPVEGCPRDVIKPKATVCGPCWNAMAGMCLGKRPMTEPKARRVVTRMKDLEAYWCRVCGWWHNGHPVDDPEALIEYVGRVMQALQIAKGLPWVTDLVASFNPEMRDRKEWVQCRPSRAGSDSASGL